MKKLILRLALAAVAVSTFAPAASAGPVGEAACDAVLRARNAIGFYPMGGNEQCPGGIKP